VRLVGGDSHHTKALNCAYRDNLSDQARSRNRPTIFLLSNLEFLLAKREVKENQRLAEAKPAQRDVDLVRIAGCERWQGERVQ